MVEVLSGFTVVWVIILAGYLTGKSRVLGEHGQVVLSRTAFFVASPALLFDTLSQADVASVLGAQLWVATFSALLSAGVYWLISWWLLPRRAASEKVIAALGSSMVNSANLGLPIAAYVLGNAAWAAPVLIFQLAIYTPLYAFALDNLTARPVDAGGSATRSVRPSGFWRTVGRSVLMIARNPMIIGSGAGLLFSVTGWQLFEPLYESISLIGGASIPAMLLAFGMSLVGSRPLEKSSGRRPDVLVASAVKLILHPVLAWVFGLMFGLEGTGMLVAVVLGALPAAQNVFVAASRYNTGLVVAKDTVLVTTVVAIPAMTLVAVIFA